jgi:hypothetical protein
MSAWKIIEGQVSNDVAPQALDCHLVDLGILGANVQHADTPDALREMKPPSNYATQQCQKAARVPLSGCGCSQTRTLD